MDWEKKEEKKLHIAVWKVDDLGAYKSLKSVNSHKSV